MATPQVQSIRAAQLTKVQGAPRVGSVRSPHRDAVADTLTPERLGALMRRADEGDLTAYLTLAEEMEERDPHYRSVLHTRRMAVSGTPPAVELPDDSPEARRIGEAVEKRIVLTPLFEGLVHDLLDALGKGFSCIEILWQREPTEWYPIDFVYREPRHFVFDQDTLSTPLLLSDRTDLGAEQGEPLRPYQWLVHRPKLASGIPIRTGLARTVAVAYACKRWTAADWMAFLDIYGVPIRVGKYPAHATKDQIRRLLRAMVSLGSDAAAVIPQEMQIELIETKGGASGQALFRETVEYWDKQVSKCVIGQTMSSDDGSSLSQAKVHEQVRYDIRDADSRAVAATIDEQLIKPFVVLNFGEQQAYPKLRLKQRKPEDLVPLMQAVKLYVDLGGRVQASEVRDRLGLMEPEDGAELLQPKPAPTIGGVPPSDQGEGNAADELAEEDDRIEQDGRDIELNAARSARSAAAAYDAVDELAPPELAKWRALENENVGRLLRLIQNAESYEEARALLEELKRDEGEVLDVGALVVSLARSMFKLRGLGDATDELKP